jgi:hypothetical protein
MAVYYCEGCQLLLDDDYYPMSEGERCPDCEAEREEKRLDREQQIQTQHDEWKKRNGHK